MIRKTIHYSGNVQGVGFRYTAQRIAAGYDVTGFVKNLPDNRVQLVLEGDEKTVNAMLEELADVMSPNIRDTKIDTSPPTSQFKRFEIAY